MLEEHDPEEVTQNLNAMKRVLRVVDQTLWHATLMVMLGALAVVILNLATALGSFIYSLLR